jgi:hypothetical protein
MHMIQEEKKQLITRREACDLHSKYTKLASSVETKDPVLFEGYYQRAEHYLHLMRELEDAPIPFKRPSKGNFLRRNWRNYPKR